MELTQNSVLNVDRKPGSVNRLASFLSVYSTVNPFNNKGKY